LDRLKIGCVLCPGYYGEDDSKSGIIAAATIGLGHSFGFEVIAEGVETEAQLALFKKFMVVTRCRAIICQTYAEDRI